MQFLYMYMCMAELLLHEPMKVLANQPYIHTYIHTCIHTYMHTYIHGKKTLMVVTSRTNLKYSRNINCTKSTMNTYINTYT
jgi:hypothetical protein